MMNFEQLLKDSTKKHGHLCAGQVIGVRMAMLGCHLVGIDLPKDERFRKKLLVYVEIDRCATDAIASVTGCQLGKRTMKFRDYGINAATFLNTTTHVAYRIVSTEESRDLAKQYAPSETNKKLQQIEGYKNMPDNLLFDVQRVTVRLEEVELPGPSRRYTTCAGCGQIIRDGREVVVEEQTICRPCSADSYFSMCESRESAPFQGYHSMEAGS